MKASVGIVTYNRPETMKMVLDNLKIQTKKPLEIIVVDSSENNETEKLTKKYKKIKYIRTKKRLYQPQARNIILKKCRGDIIAFLDDDAIPKKDWMKNILKGFEYENAVGVTGPAITCNKKLKPTMKILRTDKNQNYFTSYGDMRSESRRWVPPKPVFCSLMLGANMSFLLKPLEEIGFDEFYSHDAAVREETDPQIALIKKGFRFIYMPKAFVYHLKSEIGGIRTNNKKDYYYWAGVHHKYLCDKYFPKWKTRLAWLFVSKNPPCLPLCIILSLIRKDLNILKWIKGLWL